MRPILPLLLALTTACGGTTCELLEVTATELLFTDVIFGIGSELSVEVYAPCEGGQAVHSTVQGAGFSVGEWAVEGDSARATVRYEAAKAGLVTGSLRVVAGENEVEIALTAFTSTDQDGDGHAGGSGPDDDCDDTDPTVYPGQHDGTVDGVDSDCDGLIDEDAIGVGDILINEIHVRPLGGTLGEAEWLELYNGLPRDVRLDGFVLGQTTKQVTLPVGLTIPAHGYLVLAASDDQGDNGGVEADWAYGPGALVFDDLSDSVELTRVGFPVDTLSWFPDDIIEGRAHALDPLAHQSKADDRAWCPATDVLAGGDFGSPGVENAWCDDWDHDGDGFTVSSGDCDDSDFGISPLRAETLDGRDQDCNGRVDDTELADVVTGQLYHTVATIGHWGQFGTGDVDDDGVAELIVVHPDPSGVDLSVVPVRPSLDWSHAIRTVRSVGLSAGFDEELLAVPPRTEPVISGTAHLVVAGLKGQESALWLFDADDLDTAIGTSAASHRLDGFALGVGALHADADLDGDGLAELVFTDSPLEPGKGVGGGIYVYSVADLGGGNYDLQQPDWRLSVGLSPTSWVRGSAVADVDGDGLADVVACTPEYSDDETALRGACWLVLGHGVLIGEQDLPAAAVWGVLGASVRERLGVGTWQPLLADLDGDGAIDLALSRLNEGEVAVYSSVGSLEGTVYVSGADLRLSGSHDSFGESIGAADSDANGVAELVVAEPGDSASLRGTLWAIEGTALTAGGYVDASTSALWSVLSTEGFGTLLLPADANADGLDELWVGDSTVGRIYVISR